MKTKLFSLLLITPLLLCSCKNKDKEIKEKAAFDDGGRVIIHTKVQQAFLKDSVDNVTSYAKGVEELSRPISPTFTWNGGKNFHTVTISENPDYSDGIVYKVNKSEVSFQNLKIDTKYYFKAESSGIIVHEESFTTSDELIRTLYISGVTNARDLGGYPAGDKKVKQGLIYRSGRLNENSKETVKVKINESGIKTMVEDLKVKSEIDLRGVEDNEVGGLTEGVGVLGESVKYYQCPMDYTHITADYNTESLRKVFSILGNKDNYPAVFHCSIGTDRTGYVAWVINAFLGVSEENLYRDYVFSNFGYIGGSRLPASISGGYVTKINNMQGETLSEKAKNWLLARGISEADLAVLKEMML